MSAETHALCRHFAGTEILLPCTLEPHYCSFPEPDESSLILLILLLKPISNLCFLIILDSLFILALYSAALSVAEVMYLRSVCDINERECGTGRVIRGKEKY